MSKQLSKDNKAKLGELLQAAHAGTAEVAWLHRLVLEAGYAPVARGENNRVLVALKDARRWLGISRRTVDHWVGDGMPVFRHGTGSLPTLFDLSAILKWQKERERETREMCDDPLLAGEASGGKWLEEYRKERTIEIRRKNAEAQGKLVDAADQNAQFAEVARIFRDEAEAMERTHGPDVGQDIRNMVKRAEAAVEKFLARAIEKGTDE